MTQEEYLYNRPNPPVEITGTPEQRQRMAAIANRNGGRISFDEIGMELSQPSPANAAQEAEWEKQGREQRIAEYKQRGLPLPAELQTEAEPAETRMSREPQTDEERWERQGREQRIAEYESRGLPLPPDLQSPGGMSMSRDASDIFAPLESVKLQNNSEPPTMEQIRGMADDYDNAIKATKKVEAESVHSNDPGYGSWKQKLDAARHEEGKASTALADGLRLRDQAGLPNPPEYRRGGRLHPDTIRADREQRQREADDDADPDEKAAREWRDEQLRQRGHIV